MKETWASKKKRKQYSVATELRNYYINHFSNKGGRDCACIIPMSYSVCRMWTEKDVNFSV